MSHSKIRTEKRCLNCGAETPFRFCPHCGQENIEPKQSVWHLITHFFSDITHFDGKFFVTVKDLFTKPGFLSREYMIGRRVSYLDPIRMYIFTSAFFFLVFFSIFNVDNMVHVNKEDFDVDRKAPALNVMLSEADNHEDSLDIIKNYKTGVAPIVGEIRDSLATAKVKQRYHASNEGNDFFSLAEYDSVQRSQPMEKRDGWFRRKYNIRKAELNEQFKKDPGGTMRGMITKFLHNSPKVLFISLPIFAVLLKLLYVRRKNFYYVDHGIFAVHLYIFSFLILLILFAFNSMHHYLGWKLFYWLIGLVALFPFFYYYKAMRKFYGQRRGKTLVKYVLLLLLSAVVQFCIFLTAFILSVAEL